MSSLNSFSSINAANTYSSPLRRTMTHGVAAPNQSPMRYCYGDSQDSGRPVMSPMNPLPIRSTAAFGCRNDFTPRRVSPSTAYPRTPRGPVCGSLFVGGPISPRYAISVQRRYQVRSDYSPSAVAARRAMTPSGRVFPKTVCRGATAQKNGCCSPVPSPSLGKTGARLSPTQPPGQPHSAVRQPQQPLPIPREQHAVGRPSPVIRGMHRENSSFQLGNKSLSSTEEVSVNQSPGMRHEQKMYTPRQICSGNSNVRRFNMKETHPSRESSLLGSGTKNIQHPQNVPLGRCANASARRLSRHTAISPTCQLPSMKKDVATDASKQREMCSIQNHELPTQECMAESALPKSLALSNAYSSIHSTPMHCSSVSDMMNKSHSRHETTTTTTNGTTPVHSNQDSSRSSTEASNVGGNVALSGTYTLERRIGVSFISSRQLLRQFVLRWRNRCEENQNAYSEGGYMTVIPGKKLNSRYVIVQKLGWGEFSTVWLAYDTMHTTHGKPHQAFVAVKIAKCSNTVSESTQYEVNLIRYVAMQAPQDAPLTNLIDCFEVRGQYGFHVCMVMPLHGSNLLSIIDTMKMNKRLRSAAEIKLFKEIIASVLVGLSELENMSIIHTDIKPENILSSMPDPKILEVIERFCDRNKERSSMVPHETIHEALLQGDPNHLVCLADFGLSLAMEPSKNVRTKTSAAHGTEIAKRRVLLNSLLGSKKELLMKEPGKVVNSNGMLIQTREYRAPEILLGMDFNARSDIWSVGCVLYELITGDFLMDPKRATSNERLMDIEHLAMMMLLLGPVPPEIVQLRNAPRPGRPPPRYIHRYFDESGRFLHAAKYRLHTRRQLDRELEAFLPAAEARGAAHFILACLSCYDPALRPSARELLGHKWLEEVVDSRLKS